MINIEHNKILVYMPLTKSH